MKVKNALYMCMLLGLVGTTGPALNATPIDPKANLAAKEIAAPALNALASHRALYTVKLGSAKNGGHVSGITGKMFFSVADDCKAWNIEQKMQVRFYYSEGEVSDNTSDLISRENKDGSNYVFYSRRKNDSDAPEVLRGEAELSADATGKANYGDSNKQIAFKTATLFPVHHTLELLKQARAGKNFFTVDVFDGADENGYNQISAFIGSAIAADANKMTPAKADAKAVNDGALTNQRGWPIRMAFFSPDNDRGAPDYEMDMVLLDNGVIKSMRVDYGDFSMTADLAKAEALPPTKCSAGG